MSDRIYCCIDLKSYYASVECVSRGLDPMTAKLVVADPERSDGTVCLAVSPALKALGVKSRCRMFEIPTGIDYIVAKPQMRFYMEKSAEIYSIYLRYVSKDDIHVYSIDECFIDLTDYVSLYDKTPRELVVMLIDAVKRVTGIPATAGVGTNLFLAKTALDITAKKSPDFIGYLDDYEFKKTIWHHRPITDVWNVGHGIAERLKKYGVFDLFGITKCPEELLYKEFGVNAELLIDHAYGKEPCTIKDIHEYKAKSNSLSNGQVLFSDYGYEDALLIVKEMAEQLVLEMVEKNFVTDSISLYVNYSDGKNSGGTKKLSFFTSSNKTILKEFTQFFRERVDKEKNVRKINVGLNNLVDEYFVNSDLFLRYEEVKKEKKLQHAVLDIKNKYGKNSILKGISFEDRATQRERNRLIGGHNGGENADR